MNLEKLRSKKAVADGIYNLEVKCEYIHPQYLFEYKNNNEIFRNGLLSIFYLKPKVNNLYSFIGRWDNNKQVLDIDILEANGRDLFKSEKDGYKGHHPKRLDKDKRTYEIEICYPVVGLIYKGLISFNVNFGKQLNESFNIQDKIKYCLSKIL
ncbi:MAG: hypothetical protein JNN11_00825 [Candidatus Doudnabacteria bacterium]|nr:hypothetical protein [Candidatus Doudnabacteria bacterium]